MCHIHVDVCIVKRLDAYSSSLHQVDACINENNLVIKRKITGIVEGELNSFVINT